VVTWYREPLGALANRPLEDARTVVELGDVGACRGRSVGRFDAVLLDVDNGPVAMAQEGNARLYGDEGLAVARAALAPDGVLAVWSAWDDKKFEHRMRHAGFAVETVHVRARLARGGPNHTIFLGFLGGEEGAQGRAQGAASRTGMKSEGVGRARPRRMT